MHPSQFSHWLTIQVCTMNFGCKCHNKLKHILKLTPLSPYACIHVFMHSHFTFGSERFKSQTTLSRENCVRVPRHACIQQSYTDCCWIDCIWCAAGSIFECLWTNCKYTPITTMQNVFEIKSSRSELQTKLVFLIIKSWELNRKMQLNYFSQWRRNRVIAFPFCLF